MYDNFYYFMRATEHKGELSLRVIHYNYNYIIITIMSIELGSKKSVTSARLLVLSVFN